MRKLITYSLAIYVISFLNCVSISIGNPPIISVKVRNVFLAVLVISYGYYMLFKIRNECYIHVVIGRKGSRFKRPIGPNTIMSR